MGFSFLGLEKQIDLNKTPFKENKDISDEFQPSLSAIVTPPDRSMPLAGSGWVIKGQFSF